MNTDILAAPLTAPVFDYAAVPDAERQATQDTARRILHAALADLEGAA